MSNTRNQCDGVGHATKSAMSLDRDFAQLTQSYQAHGGEVNTGMTPQVQYSYADGSSNTIRITGMTYPNGRNVVDDYGTADSLNHFPFGGEQKGTLYLSIKVECPLLRSNPPTLVLQPIPGVDPRADYRSSPGRGEINLDPNLIGRGFTPPNIKGQGQGTQLIVSVYTVFLHVTV